MSVRTTLLPTRDRPDRGWVVAGLVMLVIADAIVLAFLPKAILVLIGAMAIPIAVLLAWNLPWAIAFVAVGFPLLDGIWIVTREDWPAFYITRLCCLAAILLVLLARTEHPGRIVKRVLGDPIFLWALALGALLAVGMAWTPSPWYGRMKVSAYFKTDLFLLLAGMMLTVAYSPHEERTAPGLPAPGASPRDGRLDRYFIAVIAFALAIALVGLVNWKMKFYKFETRLLVLGINPIWLARTTGIAILSMFALRAEGRMRWRSLATLSMPIGAVMVLTGSRGPALGLILVAFIWAVAMHRTTPTRRTWILVATVAAGVLFFFLMPQGLRERFLSPVSRDVSGFKRMGLMTIVRRALAFVPGLGIGTGGFSEVMRAGDMRIYPHNLFAEIGIENGIPGLVLLGGLLIAVVRRAVRYRSDSRMTALLLAFLFSLWNAQWSGDILSNEWIWLYAGLIAGRTG